MDKTYLGDGAYVEKDQFGGVVLTTEDGVSTTNRIVLESDLVASLVFWLRRHGLIASALLALYGCAGKHAAAVTPPVPMRCAKVAIQAPAAALYDANGKRKALMAAGDMICTADGEVKFK